MDPMPDTANPAQWLDVDVMSPGVGHS
jgi:hypothetical protein